MLKEFLFFILSFGRHSVERQPNNILGFIIFHFNPADLQKIYLFYLSQDNTFLFQHVNSEQLEMDIF